MASDREGLDQLRASINVTPLVDVLLVLLIIFIMVAPILTKAMRSDIPQKAAGPIPAEYAERQLVLHLSADGFLRLNREEIGRGSLVTRLDEVFAQRGGERLLFLDADPEVAYGAVIEIMDLCRDGGVQTIGVVPDSIRSI